MKHGVSTYSFFPLLQQGVPLVDIIGKAADLGFEGVELANLTGNLAYDIGEMNDLAREKGIEYCAWSTSADFSKDINKATEFVCQEIDRADAVGCGVIRTDIYHSEVTFPYGEEMLEAVRQLASYAEKHHMVLVTENHGGYFATADRLEMLFEKVSHPNFGLLCDFGNFADADEEVGQAVKLLKYRIRHVHMKDCHLLDGERLYPGEGWYVTRGGNYWRCAISGQGNLPMLKLIKALVDAGYDGYLVQEFEGIEDCEYALKSGLDFTKRLISALPMTVWKESEL